MGHILLEGMLFCFGGCYNGQKSRSYLFIYIPVGLSKGS